jgi:Flp pilus assembly protein TadB
MTALLAALAAMTFIGGLLLIVAGLQRVPVGPPRPVTNPWVKWWQRRNDARALAVAGLLGGLLLFALSGWFIAVLLCPLAAVGLPYLLAPTKAVGIDRLDAMAEWTRSLSGVLTVGMGLEQALIATQRSAPAPIAPEINRLVVRLRARWDTETALRAFADDLDDATGDLIAAALILGARRRGAGLATVLDGLAQSVAAEVRVRRQIEADRAKPRATARWITMITLGALALMFLNGDYIAPYGTPVGQLMLGVFLAAYAGALLWLRRVAAGRALPRFLGAGVAREVAR